MKVMRGVLLLLLGLVALSCGGDCRETCVSNNECGAYGECAPGFKCDLYDRQCKPLADAAPADAPTPDAAPADGG
jgi:hypothetical protein